MFHLRSWLARHLWGAVWVEEEKHTQKMREAWTLAAKQLGICYSTGSQLVDDSISGVIDGFAVTIRNVSDFDVQKMVTQIWLFSDDFLPASLYLEPAGLLTAYDEAVRSAGAVPESGISDEIRAWFLGQRYGIGTEVREGNLLYSQHYGMDNSEQMVQITKAMALMAKQLKQSGMNSQESWRS